MGVRNLAEAIILQSMEDLWEERHRANSMEFFLGEGFHICAHMAGMDVNEKSKVKYLAWKIIRHEGYKKAAPTEKPADRFRAKIPAMTF